MSRIPGASPITDDIEEIRHSDRDGEEFISGDDAETLPEPAPGEETREDHRDQG